MIAGFALAVSLFVPDAMADASCGATEAGADRLARLAIVREGILSAQATPIDNIVVGEIDGQIVAFVVDPPLPIVVPKIKAFAVASSRRLGRVVILDGAGSPVAVGPRTEQRATRLVVAEDKRVGLLPVEVGAMAVLERFSDDRSLFVLPGRSLLQVSGGCVGALTVAPSVGGTVILSAGRIEFEQTAAEVLVRGGGGTVSLSPCCFDLPKPVVLSTLRDMFDAEAVVEHVRHARIQQLGMPADRSTDIRDWLENLGFGRFDEAMAIADQLLRSPYGDLPAIRYLALATELGRGGRGRLSMPAALDTETARLPGWATLKACREASIAEGVAKGAAAPLARAELAKVPRALRDLLLRCRILTALRSGDARPGLDALRELGPLDQDDTPLERMIENVLLLRLGREERLANLYRDRLEQRVASMGLPVSLVSYRWSPEVEALFSDRLVVEQLLVRRLSFGDATLDAGMLAGAIASASPATIAIVLERHADLARLMPDERLGNFLVGRLVHRIVETFGTPQTPMPLRLVLALSDLGRRPNLGPIRRELSGLIAFRTLGIGAVEASMKAFVELATADGAVPLGTDVIERYVWLLVETLAAVSTVGEALSTAQDLGKAIRANGAETVAAEVDRAIRSVAAANVALAVSEVSQDAGPLPSFPEISILEQVRRIKAEP